MESLLSLELIRIDVGKLEVLKIFRTETDAMIIGGRVAKGKIVKDVQVDILRDDKVIGTGKITELQSNKQEVKEAKSGSECGLKFEGKAKIEHINTFIHPLYALGLPLSKCHARGLGANDERPRTARLTENFCILLAAAGARAIINLLRDRKGPRP